MKNDQVDYDSWQPKTLNVIEPEVLTSAGRPIYKNVRMGDLHLNIKSASLSHKNSPSYISLYYFYVI